MSVTPNGVAPNDPLAVAYARMARAEMQQLRECLQALDRGENIGVYHAALAPYVAEVVDG